MEQGARWLLLLGLVALGCAFDASGAPTASDDGTGVGSGESSSGATTTSSSTTIVTTADSASASAEASTDPTAVDETSTAGVTADETSTTAADTTDAMSTDDSSDSTGSTGSLGPICGNGTIESPETCETGDFGEFVCSDLGDEYTGTPTCAGCQLDTDACCWATGVLCVPGANDCCDGCGFDFVCD